MTRYLCFLFTYNQSFGSGSFISELFLLIQTKPNTTKNAARIKEKSNVSSSNSQPKNIVKMGLKKEKLATLDAG